MQTDELIRSLSGGVTPVLPGAARRRILMGLAAGAVFPLLSVALLLGVRPDIGAAIQDVSFWVKFVYTAALSLSAVMATLYLSRPEVARLRTPWLLGLLPVAALLLLAIREAATMSMDAWLGLWLGRSELKCMALIVLLSLPVYAGLVWSFRQLAPGNLRLAGAMAGLSAGACAATLYGLHCTESAMAFVFAWYSLGMVLAALAGMLAAPRFLRW